MDEVVVVESSSKSTTTARLPRWTRQEILVLIQGKRVAENRGRTSSGRAHESKWAAVSSYCRRHGANRGPVQCRKRWSNLSSDFKKIKEWEVNNNKGSETESYWAMRNDLRREKKLPGFFDREVYDILAGGGGGCDADVAAAEEEHDGSAHPPEKAEPDPVTEQHGKTVQSHGHDQECTGQGSDHDLNQPGDGGTAEEAEEGRKRKRYASEDVDGEEEALSLEHRLMEALENNGKLFSSCIETHNTHLRLDREQRKEQSNSIVTALNKIVDTLGRIADKL